MSRQPWTRIESFDLKVLASIWERTNGTNPRSTPLVGIQVAEDTPRQVVRERWGKGGWGPVPALWIALVDVAVLFEVRRKSTSRRAPWFYCYCSDFGAVFNVSHGRKRKATVARTSDLIGYPRG